VAALSAGCTAFHGNAKAIGSELPSLSAVRGVRFVKTVDLDGGDLIIAPPGTDKARVPASFALSMFRAADAVEGTYDFSVVGLGLVTVSPAVATPASTTTSSAGSSSGAAASTTAPGAPTTASGSTTTAAPGTTTSTTGTTTTASTTVPGGATTTTGAAPGATTTEASTTVPVPGGVVPASLPSYDGRLAWVGIAWNPGCASAAGSTTTTASTTTTGSTLSDAARPDRYTVVVCDAPTGHDVLAYTSAGPATCGGPVQPPTVTRPDELVSVPWQVVGPGSTAVLVSLPACASYQGWTELEPTGAIEVEASVPFDPACGAMPGSQSVASVVPLGNAQAAVPHAALGPVVAERTLPGG
jgi:hypothetical protein